MIRAARVLGATCLLAHSLTVATAHADAAADERGHRAREIAESINSPFCPASTLASCGSPNAAEWRADIRRWVDEGLTKPEICARLEARVDHPLCAVPRSPLGWSLPFVFTALSVGLLAWLLRRFVHRPDAPQQEQRATPGPTDAELDERLDRELAELDED